MDERRRTGGMDGTDAARLAGRAAQPNFGADSAEREPVGRGIAFCGGGAGGI